MIGWIRKLWRRGQPSEDNRALWREKYGLQANSDCPAMGEGLSHVWVGSGLNMGCTACHLNIPREPD